MFSQSCEASTGHAGTHGTAGMLCELVNTSCVAGAFRNTHMSRNTVLSPPPASSPAPPVASPPLQCPFLPAGPPPPHPPGPWSPCSECSAGAGWAGCANVSRRRGTRSCGVGGRSWCAAAGRRAAGRWPSTHGTCTVRSPRGCDARATRCGLQGQNRAGQYAYEQKLIIDDYWWLLSLFN